MLVMLVGRARYVETWCASGAASSAWRRRWCANSSGTDAGDKFIMLFSRPVNSASHVATRQTSKHCIDCFVCALQHWRSPSKTRCFVTLTLLMQLINSCANNPFMCINCRYFSKLPSRKVQLFTALFTSLTCFAQKNILLYEVESIMFNLFNLCHNLNCRFDATQ